MDSTARLACPDCKLDLTRVESGSVVAHRCPRCRGVWLDPDSFRIVCAEESRPPGDDAELVAAPRPRARRAGRPQEARVRYRPCPACGEVMNRSNFGRVSGVVLDVCRADGAWFDRGELGAIRRFLRDGGLHRYDRIRRLDAEAPRTPTIEAGTPGGASVDDVFDVLVGGGGWDVPRRIPSLPAAAVLGVFGAGCLWTALYPRGSFDGMLGGSSVGLGLTCLYFAWRAFEQWAARPPR